MNELIILIVVTIVSFWGSIQLGPVNVCVIQTALSRGKQQALYVAIGGCIPELIYSSIAIAGTNFLASIPGFMKYFGWIIVAILFILGIYYFFKPYQVQQIKQSAGAGFAKGFTLAIFNPQLLPFWIGVLVYLKGIIDFEQGTFISPYITFVIGTALGAYLILYTFTYLAIRYKDKLEKILKNNLNKWVGVLFFALASFELVRRLIM